MKTTKEIKNYIQLHTSYMEKQEYVSFMRELAEWATSQADIAEYRDENLKEFNEYNEE